MVRDVPPADHRADGGPLRKRLRVVDIEPEDAEARLRLIGHRLAQSRPGDRLLQGQLPAIEEGVLGTLLADVGDDQRPVAEGGAPIQAIQRGLRQEGTVEPGGPQVDPGGGDVAERHKDRFFLQNFITDNCDHWTTIMNSILFSKTNFL